MHQEFYEKLQKIVPANEILVNEPMSKHTTFRIGGNADVFVSPEILQVSKIMALAKEYDVPVTVIGNGSNLLVGDKGIRGLVLSFGKEAEEIELDGRCMTVGAGTILAKVATEAARNGLTGLEFAAGIPGSLGGAIVMNAGAYDGEMKDVVVSAKVLTPEGEVLELSKEELELSYRHSCIPEKGYIVLEATLELSHGEEAAIREKMEDFRNRRIDKQPLEYPSAGSTFKRPEGYFAGKLIQDAGLRGYQVGGAQVSEKHCGFVINKGNASAADVLQLIEDVQRIVYDTFQVELEPEVKMIGEFQ
ncbi:MAG: UDP-N-acetylmuramate dehydrogenase [Agathobacter sp.]|nr:UDP-N-acetylmuramate dehydrogenase [Agathobacter sp.]